MTPGQKCDMQQSGVDRTSFQGNDQVSNMGKAMAIVTMIPIGRVTALDRSIILTERRFSGSGGNDFLCGHCGSLVLSEFDPSTVRDNPVYRCAYCENNNDLPFAASDNRIGGSGDAPGASEVLLTARPHTPTVQADA